MFGPFENMWQSTKNAIIAGWRPGDSRGVMDLCPNCIKEMQEFAEIMQDRGWM
jgi:hypothetical protein